MATFEYPNAVAVRDVFLRHGVRYLFFGKSGAILLGYSDTTQDVDLFVDKQSPNGERLVAALPELGQLDRKALAALVGVAPLSCESGT
jgi:hypothetical protein